MNKVYHGSYIKIDKPQIMKVKYTKDFGVGFYCTNIKKQAMKWSTKFETHIVNVYNLNIDNSLKILEFTEMNDKWLEFIVDCRNGIKHEFDIVIGAMADDQVYNYITDYIEGVINKEQFWVLAKFKYPTHQIAFCTQKALNCIEFLENEEIK